MTAAQEEHLRHFSQLPPEVEEQLAAARTELNQFGDLAARRDDVAERRDGLTERRADLATITVSLLAPQARFSEPHSASIGLESTEVTRRVGEAKTLIASVSGEVDQVFTSVRDGEVRASLTARVFARDFDRVLGSIESLGKVVNKDVR